MNFIVNLSELSRYVFILIIVLTHKMLFYSGFTGVKLCHMNRTNLVPPIGDIDSSDNEEEKNVIEIQAPSSSTPATKRKKTGRSRCMSGDSGDDAPQKKRMYNLDI